MGVPRLFPWLVTTFPSAVKHFQEGEVVTEVDNLYLDANGILHSAFQVAFNYGGARRPVDPYAALSYDERIVKGFQIFFETVVRLTRMVVPTRLLYIAIDGPAPLAKQSQQRQRRMLAAIASSSMAEGFNSNVITPGTRFELELTKFIHYAIRKTISSDPRWRKIEVIFSPPIVPGEGEHIIMDHIRRMPDAETQSHCIFGPDGDLIMLCLATHLPRIFLFREDQYQPGFYDLLNMGMVRERLAQDLGQISGIRTKRRTLNDVSNDFILLGFFVGNDFLPRIRMFIYLEQGLELMIATYNNISGGGMDNFLTRWNRTLSRTEVNLAGFTRFVEELARREHQYILDQASIPPVDPRFRNETLLRHVHERPGTFAKPVYNLNMPAYRIDYYAKAGVDAKVESQVRGMCLQYIRSVVWVYQYYVTGLPSWTDYYPYHYAPLMVDLASTLRELTAEQWVELTTFDKGEASLPFVQLLCVLPPKSSSLLPGPFRKLFTDPNSPLVRAGYYPSELKIDYEGQIKEHMGVVLLPFVDVATVRAAYAPIAATLKNHYVRNTVGRNEKFVYDPRYTATYISDYGKLEGMHVRKQYV